MRAAGRVAREWGTHKGPTGPVCAHIAAATTSTNETIVLTGIVAEVVAVPDRLVVLLHDHVLDQGRDTSDDCRAVENDNSGSDSGAEHEEGGKDEQGLVDETRTPGGKAVLALTVKLELRVALNESANSMA